MSDGPGRPAPDGYEFIAAEEGPEWQVSNGLLCRHMDHRVPCRLRSVLALDRRRRSRRTASGTIPNWYGYCGLPGHAYGRWVQDGKVMHWILREVKDGG